MHNIIRVVRVYVHVHPIYEVLNGGGGGCVRGKEKEEREEGENNACSSFIP